MPPLVEFVDNVFDKCSEIVGVSSAVSRMEEALAGYDQLGK